MLTPVVDNTSTIAPTLTPSETSPDTERALADEAAATHAAFSLKPPVYAIGTAVNATGERNFRQSRREFQALPYATDACADLAQRVQAERRCDTIVDTPRGRPQVLITPYGFARSENCGQRFSSATFEMIKGCCVWKTIPAGSSSTEIG